MSRLDRACTLASTIIAAASLTSSPVFAQTVKTTERVQPAQKVSRTVTTERRGQSPRSAAAIPQGFSVVLVLGDLQGANVADDVPAAARKALTDMRDFLPYKSYRLLDAAWMMCCGQQPRSTSPAAARSLSSSNPMTMMSSQTLRGPDDQEYELKLMTSRADAGRVFVRFTLMGSATPEAVTPTEFPVQRSSARRIADLQDKRALLESQLQSLRSRVEIGTANPEQVPKLEVELRTVTRELEELKANAATAAVRAAKPAKMIPSSSPVIDTSFTMDVGETVVVGTSRMKGGSKALIALLTAVPPKTGGAAK